MQNASIPLAPTPPPAGRSVGSFYQIWLLVLRRPREDTFQALVDDPGATVGRGALWIFLTSMVGYVVAFTVRYGLFASMLEDAGQTAGFEGMTAGVAIAVLCGLPLAAAMAVLGFMLSAALLQFIAGALGGDGTFRQLFFATASYTAPVTLAGSLLSVIPLIGGCLALPLSIYTLYLNALAIKAVNRFSWAAAMVTLFIPVIFWVLLAVIVALALLPLIEQSLGSPA
jgi:hypothetical protein